MAGYVFQKLDHFEVRTMLINDNTEAWTPQSLEVRLWGSYQFACLDLINGQSGAARYSVFVGFDGDKPVVRVTKLHENGTDELEILAKVVCE